MSIDKSALIWSLINFALLLVLLRIFLYKPMMRFMANRKERIAQSLEEAAAAREEVANTQKKVQEILIENQEEAKGIINQAKAQAQEKKEELLAKASQEAASLRQRSLAELQEQKAEAAQEVQKDLADMVALVAEKVLRDKSFDQQKQALVDRYITEVSQQLKAQPSDKLKMKEGKSLTARVVSAVPLTDDERQTFSQLFLDTFENPVRIINEIDPDVTGGMRIQIGDTVYDGTLTHQLNRLNLEIGASPEQKEMDAEAISQELKKQLAGYQCGIDVFQMGTVLSVGDGICRIAGLSDVMSGEMLEFKDGLKGMVLDLEKDNVGCVLLGSYEGVQEGDTVRRTGRIIETPVGEALIGRVVDSLGRPIDGRGPIVTDHYRPLEGPAPSVLDRQSVSVPLQTGLKAVDALVPIGRGQRELIIGDRQTGKTAIALDAIINQKGKDVICIYVAIGQKESTVAAVVENLRTHGAMDYSIVVSANASEPAPMLYIAPYAGAAMGEYFMYEGKDVLIVYDDLSKQAVAYRELSLLLHRPPGREAYPGDVFYLHSRLLERAARLSAEKGGGSMTALPIIETQAGDISAYIPTNVISITDGQIFLESDLFHAGVRPAVNVGLSVSRVGGAAQVPAMKQVAGRLRMDLAQYRELASFAQFGSDLDKSTKEVLDRGDRMTEILKQDQYKPMPVADQIVSIFAASEGFAADVDVHEMYRFEDELLAYLNTNAKDLMAEIATGKKMSAEVIGRLKEAINGFKKTFR